MCGISHGFLRRRGVVLWFLRGVLLNTKGRKLRSKHTKCVSVTNIFETVVYKVVTTESAGQKRSFLFLSQTVVMSRGSGYLSSKTLQVSQPNQKTAIKRKLYPLDHLTLVKKVNGATLRSFTSTLPPL